MSHELRDLILARQVRQRQVAFAETLSYDNQLRTQVQHVTDALNVGYPNWVMNTLDTLEGMITPSMADDVFEVDMEEIYVSAEEEALAAEKEYKEQLKGAGSPDNVPKPSGMPMHILRQRFFVILSLLERKKLLLRETYSGGF